jgi:hypothetical protein
MKCRMAASTLWWENYLREMHEASNRKQVRDTCIMLLIAVAVTAFLGGFR